MSVVTDLKAQKRKGRVNVYLDGEFAFGLDAETVVRWGLKINKELTSEEVEKILREGEFQVNYEKALKFTALRPRSEKEVRDWCKRKKLGQTLVGLIFDKLGEHELIDDLEFAKWWIEQRRSFRPRGRRMMEQELWQKGVDRKVVERAFAELEWEAGGEEEQQLARRAIEKKMKAFGKLSGKEKRNRVIGFLQRRGFSWETVRKVVDEVMKGDTI
jgi:regulatory protein